MVVAFCSEWINRVRLPILLVVSWTWKKNRTKSLSLFTPENLVSRDGFGRPDPRQFTAHSPHWGRIWCLLAGFLPISTAASTYLYRQLPSGQSRVYGPTQSRTDGFYCRESAGTWPVVLKIVPVTGAAFTISPWTNQYAPLFSHSHYWYWYSLVWSG